MKQFKQVMFWVMVVVALLGMMAGGSWAQFLPFAIFFLLAYFSIWKAQQVAIPIVVVSMVMVLVNLSSPSLLDVLIWAGCVGAWIKE